uniref:Leucine-rich repeat-containing N-terminal plant-type domain-containing protein n=1 Tax=Quercus lobata TaxID=97700 RepID=A0A7N2MDP2_QUELO
MYVLKNSLGMMRWFIWLSQLFYLLLLLHFQLTSSSSSSFSSSSALLCSQVQSSVLLQFKHLFSFSESTSFLCDNSYPKMESWKVGTDFCSWDGVTCDRVRGNMIGLDLNCSWLYGTIPSNISLFLLPHLQHLNLAFNDFSISPISSGFGQFARLTYLNLSSSWFSSQVPLKLSHLSQLTSLDLSPDGFVYLDASVMKRLVKKLNKLRELQLDEVDKSLVPVSSFMNLSSSLTSLTLEACQLSGRMSNNIFHLPNLHERNLKENRELMGIFPMANWTNPLRFLDVSSTTFSGELLKSIGNLKFLRNLGLNECSFTSNDELTPPTLPSIFQEDNDSLFASGFGWKAVLISYGCGCLFGLAMGYAVFKIGKPKWLVRFVEGEQKDKKRRPNYQRPGQ